MVCLIGHPPRVSWGMLVQAEVRANTLFIKEILLGATLLMGLINQSIVCPY